MDNANLIPIFGILALIGGILLTIAFNTVNKKTGTPRHGLILFGIGALLLFSVPLAFFTLGIFNVSPAGLGIGLTFGGLCAWLIGVFYIRANPEREFRQPFTPTGSFAMSVGMILTGIAILNTDLLPTPWQYIPLLTGVFFLAQFPIQAIFFIRTQGSPSYHILSLWGILWAATGISLLMISAGG
jgi:hypothetical protein